jgi:cation:H+ antiporter
MSLATVFLLITSAIVIYLSCELFVNGVEWVGRKAGLAETAVGTILAAFGTALPESVVTFVAVAFGRDDAARDIGVGAALGGPLVLSTIAYAVVGWVMLVRRGSRELDVDRAGLIRDQGWFLVIFTCKVALGVVAFSFKPVLGVAFLAAYALYFWREISRPGERDQEELEPLKLRPRSPDPGLGWAIGQTLIALAIIFAASQLFVSRLELVGPALGIPPALASLLLSPIATELPETMNAIIWVRQGKERLAMANVSGSMMIQATVPSAFGIFFTPWRHDRPLLWAAAVTMVSVLVVLLLLQRRAATPIRLAMLALQYVVFAVGAYLLR